MNSQYKKHELYHTIGYNLFQSFMQSRNQGSENLQSTVDKMKNKNQSQGTGLQLHFLYFLQYISFWEPFNNKLHHF